MTTRIETYVEQSLLSAFTGGQTAKIHFLVAPQDTKPPYLVVSFNAQVAERTLLEDTTLSNVQGTVDAVAATYTGAVALVTRAMVALDGSANFTVGSMQRIEDSYDIDTGFYATSFQFSLWYRA